MNENFKITSATFVTSVVSKFAFLDEANEIAFAGRSNVGKSSFINALCNQKKLAKTSSTPGHTKMVNYFAINKSFYFVDLPGYGYSKTGKKHKKIWSSLIEDYLLYSHHLKLVFLLVDIRHEPSALDVMMQKFLFYNKIPYKIIATKTDKVPKSKLPNYLKVIANKLTVGVKDIIPYSVHDKVSVQKILNLIGEINE